jgi:uncharacterized protein YdeI (YjbR/CyaY-like superfamily)
MKPPDHPLHCQDRDEWRRWLQDHHTLEKEAWLAVLKNKTPRPGVYYEEAVEEAVCFGWIDGLARSAAPGYYHQRFSPRKPGSVWSVSNQQRVERLLAQGKMTEAGMARVREAQENGQWQAAIQRQDVSSLPDDLRQALEANPAAQANFAKYPASQVKQFLYWLSSAKTEATRQKRLRQIVEMAANNQRLG